MLFNKSNPCPQYVSSYIYNITSSYTNKSNESDMVSASVIIFALAGLFFNLSFFSSISDVSATLDPKVRLFLSSALSLFLPVMTYLFLEAKNAGHLSTASRLGMADDLSLRAGLILAWMLLVELLRKKVDEIRMQSYSGTIQRAARVIWLGNLVFFNIQAAGRKALFSILWILCATRVVQRIAFTEFGKRSYAHGKNGRLLTSYMAQMLEQTVHQQDAGNELLKRCKYIVMGEEKLVARATAYGYELNDITPNDSVITVGKVWELLAGREWSFTSLDENQHPERLCLSFALFKLLRRRFEHLPRISDDEARNCRDLIFRGLCNHGPEEVFQVMNDEVTFLSEYYHSVVPVVLASPFFLLVNYFLLYIVVVTLCLMTIVLCGHGDVSYAFSSIATDNNTLRSGLADVVICLSPTLRKSFHIIVWLRSKMMSHGNLRLRQFSVLNLGWPLKLPLFTTPLVPNKFMLSSIVEYLVQHVHGTDTADHTSLTNGKSALHRNNVFGQLSWACKSPSIAEVVLTWHIATGILEVKCPAPQSSNEEVVIASSTMAIQLSRYCAYLVAFHPELLPGNQEMSERVFLDMKRELKDMIGCWNYYLSSRRARVEKIMESTRQGERTTDQEEIDQSRVLLSGAKLAMLLMEEARNGRLETVWKVLADVWTELIVYMAPSSDEERVTGHEEVLMHGGEFITVLWALTTHTGISRPAEMWTTGGHHPQA
ncbi:unnamed protein product [Urochloa decumbens]|uniref:DUF4220 domain-containing protein n=1 Tax=Urochloa decumbens TaxID=240449 RepID=A0ABC9DUW3_9POAL